ncbi:MAG: acetyl-CoA carboxylase biotin carboxyl carrier protein [Fimbriimonadales bacterium]
MAGLDLELVRHALKTAQEHNFATVELGTEGASFRATFEPGGTRRGMPAVSSRESKPLVSHENEFSLIKSPIVGFYRPGPAPLRVGNKVAVGEVVAVITALGIANDVESEVAGEIIEVAVHDDQPVEFGQTLAKVKA